MSPKESGEVGETYEDLLARHPDPTSTPMQLLHSIQSLSAELTPITLWQTERSMVPALSPIAGLRVPREEAIGALQCVAARLKRRKEAKEGEIPEHDGEDAGSERYNRPGSHRQRGQKGAQIREKSDPPRKC